MNSIKTIFSIKDLENLSGIKAHTIRIWEKRYNILEPMRTETNIRYYDAESLRKLLNITLLHKHGYKISQISKYPEEKIPLLVREIVSEKSAKNHAINDFKLAMMNFDQALFFNTYNNLLAKKSFPEIFNEVFIPLLNEIGLLWQSDTITPVHEHFISHLIRQKLIVNTEKLQVLEPVKTDRVFVLFLPLNEIHELGLMYIHYEILRSGYRSIYLGESIPLESLKDTKRYFSNITYVSYFTVKPGQGDVNSYMGKIRKELIDSNSECWVLGKMAQHIDLAEIPQRITVYQTISELVNNL